MRRSSWLTFSLSLAVSSVLTFAVESHATFIRRVAATSCFVDTTHISDLNNVSFNSDGVENADPDQNGRLYLRCAIPDDTCMPKQNITSTAVYGYNGNPNINTTAGACVTYYGSEGGTCGGTSYQFSVGHYSLAPVVTAWGSSHASDFGYIYLTMPPAYATAISSFQGITLTGTPPTGTGYCQN